MSKPSVKKIFLAAKYETIKVPSIRLWREGGERGKRERRRKSKSKRGNGGKGKRGEEKEYGVKKEGKKE